MNKLLLATFVVLAIAALEVTCAPAEEQTQNSDIIHNIIKWFMEHIWPIMNNKDDATSTTESTTSSTAAMTTEEVHTTSTTAVS
ncbi:hypothetical protein C0J52_08596 [Blattella germanica]|nr:hypothetical protein C0J52_08596 [Blattella germanica]